MTDTTDQQALAAAALAAKQAAQDDADWTLRQTDTPGDGPITASNEHEPVMGAFDAEGQRPVLERSRKVR